MLILSFFKYNFDKSKYQNMLTKEKIIDYLENNKDYFLHELNISKIGVFGSFARNEQTSKSDIDILIEMPRGTENISEKKQKLKEILESQFQCNVDICRERSINPLFREIILKDALYA